MVSDQTYLIDPGHGGDDPGAPFNAPIEAKISLFYGAAIGVALFSAGNKVYFTRRDNSTVSLKSRVDMEHSLRPALTLSVHCNSAPVIEDIPNPKPKGIEVWTSPGETPSDFAATAIMDRVKATFPDRRIRFDYSDGDVDKEDRFYMLTKTWGPAVLIELGFVSNKEEREWLQKVETVMRYSHAIATGILDWSSQNGEA